MTTTHDVPHLSPLDLLLREVLVPHAPDSIKEALKDAVPIMSLLAQQLGMEILVAESMSLPFIDAVERPDCLKMARVYFGSMNLLQQELPPEFRRVFLRLLNDAAQGTFEPTRPSGSEAAICDSSARNGNRARSNTGGNQFHGLGKTVQTVELRAQGV
jgi:hypothetical protein